MVVVTISILVTPQQCDETRQPVERYVIIYVLRSGDYDLLSFVLNKRFGQSYWELQCVLLRQSQCELNSTVLIL